MDAYSNCTSAAVGLTNSYLIRILGSLAAVSVATCLVSLSCLLCLKLHRQFLYRLAAYQVTGSLLHALALLCQLTFLNYNVSKYPSCVAISYLFQTAGWVKVCFGGWITFHLFCFAVLLKNMRKLEPLYVISSVLVPIGISSIPLITKSYGPTGEWCWIERKRCGNSYLTGLVEQIAEWYGPLFVILVLQSAAMLAVMVTVYYRAHRKEDEHVFGREQNKKAFKQLLPLVAYPILFNILIIPPLIGRAYGFAAEVPTTLSILSTICIPSWSLSAGVTLLVHMGVIRYTDMLACMCTPLAFLSRIFVRVSPASGREPRDPAVLSLHAHEPPRHNGRVEEQLHV